MKKPPIREFKFWFEQVNQTMISVRSRSPEAAIKRARRLWREQNAKPCCSYWEESKASD